jgi:hypothetical protein
MTADIVTFVFVLLAFGAGFAVGYKFTPDKLPTWFAIGVGLLCGALAVYGLTRLFV